MIGGQQGVEGRLFSVLTVCPSCNMTKGMQARFMKVSVWLKAMLRLSYFISFVRQNAVPIAMKLRNHITFT